MRAIRRRPRITCRRAVELVTAYLDAALPASVMRDLDEHFANCPDCRAYLAQLRETISATGRIEADRLSPVTRASLIELYRQLGRR